MHVMPSPKDFKKGNSYTTCFATLSSVQEFYIAWEILLLFSFFLFDVNDFLVGFENLELFWMQKIYRYFNVLELQIKILICGENPYNIEIQYGR